MITLENWKKFIDLFSSNSRQCGIVFCRVSNQFNTKSGFFIWFCLICEPTKPLTKAVYSVYETGGKLILLGTLTKKYKHFISCSKSFVRNVPQYTEELLGSPGSSLQTTSMSAFGLNLAKLHDLP